MMFALKCPKPLFTYFPLSINLAPDLCVAPTNVAFISAVAEWKQTDCYSEIIAAVPSAVCVSIKAASKSVKKHFASDSGFVSKIVCERPPHWSECSVQ